MYCRYCGNELVSDAIFCNRCGRSVFDTAPAPANPPVYPSYGFIPYYPRKDPLVALLLGLILGLFGLWGIGHIYIGQTLKGLILLVVGVVLGFLLLFSGLFIFIFLIGLVIWLWQAFDAYRAAEEYNRRAGGYR
jgi:TM2 domain-containing membrane protein YozV